MADRTLGFKVTDEIHERVHMLIEASGLTSKVWLENALAMYEVKALQANTPEYAKNLTDHAVKDVADKLESKEGIITELQAKASISFSCRSKF